MARRSEHTLDEIRKMVMDAADAIVIQDGYSALKVRRIAMDIGYTVGSIYMVFENMTDLIMHLKGKCLDDLSAYLDRVPVGSNSYQTILELSKAYLIFASSHYNYWSMLFEHRLPNDVAIPEWYQQKADANVIRIERLLQPLLTDNIEKQANIAAKTLCNSIYGICILSLQDKMEAQDVEAIEASIILLVESFLAGWKP